MDTDEQRPEPKVEVREVHTERTCEGCKYLKVKHFFPYCTFYDKTTSMKWCDAWTS